MSRIIKFLLFAAEKMKIFVTIPCMNEADFLPHTLNDLAKQSKAPVFKIIVVVNQPESYYTNAEQRVVCENNLRTLEYLNKQTELDLELIDRCSQGYAWDTLRYGVGWARKTAMDRAAELASSDDIILSLDADTRIPNEYLYSIAANFQCNPDAAGLAVPYYHQLTDDPDNNLAILRYELYLRCYALNMWYIDNEYSYTPIGSGMACTKAAYMAVRGISPKLSGEDFYFLLKLSKFGRIIKYNKHCVYPSTRYSDRVFFGTGPALIKGKAGDWKSYPIYHHNFFDEISESFSKLQQIFENPDVDYPMKTFLQRLFKDPNFLLPLLKNSKDRESFQKKCFHKIDALRIFQYLKYRHNQDPQSDEKSLTDFMMRFHPEFMINDLQGTIPADLYSVKNIDTLSLIRDFLFNTENVMQKNQWLSKSNPICKL